MGGKPAPDDPLADSPITDARYGVDPGQLPRARVRRFHRASLLRRGALRSALFVAVTPRSRQAGTPPRDRDADESAPAGSFRARAHRRCRPLEPALCRIDCISDGRTGWALPARSACGLFLSTNANVSAAHSATHLGTGRRSRSNTLFASARLRSVFSRVPRSVPFSTLPASATARRGRVLARGTKAEFDGRTAIRCAAEPFRADEGQDCAARAFGAKPQFCKRLFCLSAVQSSGASHCTASAFAESTVDRAISWITHRFTEVAIPKHRPIPLFPCSSRASPYC